ncbi:MAG TPA: DUF1697 domain-containing protein [Gaiellaceae bacterium]|nr:DUF1697 domain-containing protein [Gaiellaceae bacterium]
MARLIVLLRGVNLVKHNRVSMPILREALTEVGFEEVATYVQSGNVVVTTSRAPAAVAKAVAAAIDERFGLDVGVAVRTRAELAKIVERDPLGSVADDPKRYQVTFLDSPLERAALEKLEAAAVGGERVEAVGREIYTWYPGGMGRSKLARLVSGKALGNATSRNWSTVTALLALAADS